MKFQQQRYNPLWLAITVTLLLAQPVRAEFERERDRTDAVINKTRLSEVTRLDAKENHLTEAKWLTQEPVSTATNAPEVAQATKIVTSVRLNPTPTGLEVILETVAGQKLQVSTVSEGNTLIAGIPNVQLALLEGNKFRAINPVKGIASITVTNLNANSIQVQVTGTAGVPKVEVFESDERLIFSLIPASQTSKVPPALETPVTQPEVQPSEEIEIFVTGDEQEEGYRVPEATSATRTDTPLKDIPQSIQVIPKQVLEDQQAVRLQDALRNVPGVFQGNTFGNSGDAFIIRGFDQEAILRNGFRDSTGNSSFRDTANLERIEVFKGPASVLYGTLEPGGIINLITKQPLSEPFYSFELDVGNRNFVRPTIDLSGPLNSNQTLLYRLNVAYESADDFRNFDQGVERFLISPVLTWRISDRTDVTFEFEYLDDERPFDRGLVAIGDEVADIPFDRILGEPDDFSAREQFRAEYRLEHRFSENWTLRNGFQFFASDTKHAFTGTDLELDEGNGELTREISDQDGLEQNYSLQTNIIGEFATGSVEHTLLFGVDLFRESSNFDNRFDNPSLSNNVPSQNIFDPVYGFPRPDREEFPLRVDIENTTDTLGIYLQDQVTLAENLELLVGGRFDIVDQESSFRQTEYGTLTIDADTQQQEAFTPRVGIVYKPIENLSLYASFSQSFVPNTARTVDGSILDPTRGTQYEIGIKGELFDGRLSATLAAFDITKTNIAVDDPENLDFSIAIGEQRSRGVELNAIGEILPGWNIIASYAYVDAEVTEDAEVNNDISIEGNRFYGVPENSASLWTTYEIQQGDWQGLGFGLGLFFVGERQGDLDNSFQVDSFVRTDAAIFYRRGNWQTAINIQNLFDVDYIESADQRLRINPGAPFTIVGSVSVEF